MPAFDAQAARALARRARGMRDILTDMKQAIVAASGRGAFEATLPLPDSQHVPAGQSSNNAAFLVEHLQARELPAWAEAVQHAVRAGYTARPSWHALEQGAGCDGVVLSWSLVHDDAPVPPLQLMAAGTAHRMALAARAQHRWVEQAQQRVREAAAKGASVCTVRDAEPHDSDAWPRRRELLEQAGFGTELVRSQHGADLVIRW